MDTNTTALVGIAMAIPAMLVSCWNIAHHLGVRKGREEMLIAMKGRKTAHVTTIAACSQCGAVMHIDT